MTKIYIIPLGTNCSSTFILEELGLAGERNPFEWNTSESVRKVVDLFKNDLLSFLAFEQIPIISSDGEIAIRIPNHEIILNHESAYNNETKKFEITEEMRYQICDKYFRRCLRILRKIPEADKIIFFRLPPHYYYFKHEKRHAFNYVDDRENGQEILNELKELYKEKDVECHYPHSPEKLENFMEYLKSLKSNPDNIFI